MNILNNYRNVWLFHKGFHHEYVTIDCVWEAYINLQQNAGEGGWYNVDFHDIKLYFMLYSFVVVQVRYECNGSQQPLPKVCT